MDIWYAHLDEDELMAGIRAAVAGAAKAGKARKKAKKEQKAAREEQDEEKAAQIALARAEKNRAKAHTRDSLQALSKLGEIADGSYRIVSQPPIVVPVRELAATYGMSPDETDHVIRDQFRAYRATLQDDRRHLLESFEIIDWARKVVGVGSVGTRAFIVLLLGRDADDPLFLQVKEAQASVLEPYAGRSTYPHHGQRVVMGQRLMQAATDIFLGWQRIKGLDGVTRDYYVRQFHDWKGSADVDRLPMPGAAQYARFCGATLARAHARWGDRIAIASYLGQGDMFDRAIAGFSAAYADQNERDYQAFTAAVNSGRLIAQTGV
jgi:hypothetical protein